MTSGREAALQMTGGAHIGLLATAGLPMIVILNWLLLTSLVGEAIPLGPSVAVILYDLCLVGALLFLARRGRTRASVILLGLTLFPAALIGAISVGDRIAAERSSAVIH